MRYRITYRPELGLPTEVVEADSVSREGQAHVVLRGTAPVMGLPREYIVRRLRPADVLLIEAEAARP